MGSSCKELVNGLYGTIGEQLEVIESSADMTLRQLNETISVMANFDTKKMGSVGVELIVKKRYEKDPGAAGPIKHIAMEAKDFNSVRNVIMRPVTLGAAKDGAKYVIVYNSATHALGEMYAKYSLAKAFGIIDLGYTDQSDRVTLMRPRTDVNIDRYAVRELGMTANQFKNMTDMIYTEETLKTQYPDIDKSQLDQIKNQRNDMVLYII